MKTGKHFVRFVWLLVTAGLLLPNVAFPLPENPQVIEGQADISQAEDEMTITQGTQKNIINWQGYSINANELVRYIQPGSGSVSLNRVVGQDPSKIMGQLLANGQIFLINPNGVVFGKESVVNVAGLVATTLNISDTDFLSDNYDFSQFENSELSSVINKGKIIIADNGYAVLAAPLVSNEGLIVASQGKVRIGATEQFSVNFDGNQLVNFVIPGLASDAEPGTVFVPTDQVSDIVKEVVNTTELTEAGAIVEEDGVTRLVGASGTLTNSGTIQADGIAGQDAGSIILDSTQTTAVGPGSLLSASGAGENSSGGEIKVLSDMTRGTAALSGGTTVEATGGTTGDGGFIELSGNQFYLSDTASVDASAPGGTSGTFLIDPTDVTIVAAGGDTDGGGPTWDNIDWTLVANSITNTVIDGYLDAGTSVSIDTNSGFAGNGDITVNAPILQSAGLGGTTLTMLADRNLTVNQSITSTSGTLTMNFTAGNSAAGNMNINAQLNANGGDIDLTAANDINQNADITSAGGAITADATAGAITMADGTTTSTTGDYTARIAYTAGTDVALSVLDGASTVDVTAGTGAITDNLTGEAANIIGTTATLTAATGIGSADDIETTAGLDATNTGATGDIWINETTAGDTMNVYNVRQSNADGDGNILLTTEAGPIYVWSGSGVSTAGRGTITLTTITGGSVWVEDNVTSTTGKIEINAHGNGNISNSAVISATEAADIALNAGYYINQRGDVTSAGGDITLYGDTINIQEGEITSAGGDITLYGDNNIYIGTETKTAKVQAGTGDIFLDVANDGALRIDEGRAVLTMNDFAMSCIDRPGTLIVSDTPAANTISATQLGNATGIVSLNAGAGGITIDSALNLTNADLIMGNGIRVGGNVVINADTSAKNADISAGGNVFINADTFAERARIYATGTVTDGDAVLSTTDGALNITGSGIGTSDNSLDVSVTGGYLILTTTDANGSGDIYVTSASNLFLGAVHTAAAVDDVQIYTTGGADLVIFWSSTMDDDLVLDSAGNIDVDYALSAGTMDIDAAGAVIVCKTLTTAGNLDIAGGDIGTGAVVSATGAGDIDLNAANAINQVADITSAGGKITANATAGAITMADGTTTSTTGAGTIAYTAGTDVALSILDGDSTVDVTAGTGAITDNLTGKAANIIGPTATLTAATGIGSADGLETQVSSLSAANTNSGDIWLRNNTEVTGDLEVNGVTNDGGAVRIENGLIDFGSGAHSEADATMGGDITITDLISASGAALIYANGSILDGNNPVDPTALDVEAGASSELMAFDGTIGTAGDPVEINIHPDDLYVYATTEEGVYVTNGDATEEEKPDSWFKAASISAQLIGLEEGFYSKMLLERLIGEWINPAPQLWKMDEELEDSLYEVSGL